jgi:hypothetical protein
MFFFNVTTTRTFIMFFTIKSTDCPVGVYTARFNGVEEMTHPEYGPGLRFDFEISEGPHKGKRTCRITSADPTPRNVAGRILADLAGVAPSNGLSINLDDCVGREYTIVVREGESGRTRVESACAVKEDAPF